MPVKLSDLVEAVAREVALGRTRAALAGLEIAADFRDHPLLRALPVPGFRMERVEFELRFAVAEVDPVPARRISLPRPVLRKLVDAAVTRLPESEAAEKAFAVTGRLAEIWKLEAARAIVAGLDREPLEELSVEAVLALTATLARSRYLELLSDPRARAPLRRIREAVRAGLPDQLARALRRELGPRLLKAAEEERGKLPAEARMAVLVTPEELREAPEVSSLRLVLEEEELELPEPPSEGDEQ
ncbi:MAG TPA: hypothetical protein ENJ38_05745 [Rhodospirillales bacterium]|nr:hypothetical protein [Rhodospirillales bacterium]